MLRVYIAGPYTKGDVARNVKDAIRIGDYVADHGCATFIPHLTHFWHMFFEHPWEFWLRQDQEWLLQCHAFIRLAGPSEGADREEEWARSANIPIFAMNGFSLTELNRLDEFIQTCKTMMDETLPI